MTNEETTQKHQKRRKRSKYPKKNTRPYSRYSRNNLKKGKPKSKPKPKMVLISQADFPPLSGNNNSKTSPYLKLDFKSAVSKQPEKKNNVPDNNDVLLYHNGKPVLRKFRSTKCKFQAPVDYKNLVPVKHSEFNEYTELVEELDEFDAVEHAIEEQNFILNGKDAEGGDYFKYFDSSADSISEEDNSESEVEDEDEDEDEDNDNENSIIIL